MGTPTGFPTSPAARGCTDEETAIDCLLTHHPRLPRDRTGRCLSPSGRSLIIDAVSAVHGLGVTAKDLVRDEYGRWSVPAQGLSVSVAHCDAYSTVALSSGPRVGVDLQDWRDRPHAMRWLGAVLGREEPATVQDFTECEALIKASHVTKETFEGVRLPAWQPGWRPTDVPPYRVRSECPGRDLYLALATEAAVPVRWWRRPGGAARAVRTDVPTLEAE